MREQHFILEMDGIVKEFPGVRALDNVSFRLEKAEIHALVGENGAGKSTLMKILGGVYPHGTYSGAIRIDGEERRFLGTADAEKAGIGIIYQELSLARNLSIAENLFMGDEPVYAHFFIDWNGMISRSQELMERVGLARIDPHTKVRNLGIGQQQLLEIAKTMRSRSRILVLDEPTSALTHSEVENLMSLLRTLKGEGISCVYISHRLDEVFRISDRITVIRDGRTIGTGNTRELTEEKVIAMMVGRELTERFPRRTRAKDKHKEKIMEVAGLTVREIKEDREVIHDVSFTVYKDEILGIAGLMGAGRTELVAGIFGAYPGHVSGTIILNGKALSIRSPKDAIKNGIGLITEDRKNFGIIPTASIRENMSVASLGRLPGLIAISDPEECLLCNHYISMLGIKLGDLENRITSLSGGNQQKVILGRWLMTQPSFLFLDEPTRGIDVGAKYEIYAIMNELAGQGVGIVMISSDLPEILGMSDRILVMHNGRITGEMSREDATQEKIMNCAMGGSL